MSDLFIFLTRIPQVIDILNLLPIQKSNFYINSNLQFSIEYLLQMASQSENPIKAFYQYLALSKFLEEPVLQLNNIKLALNLCEELNQHYSQQCKALLQPYNSKFQLSILSCPNLEQLLEYLECFRQSMNYGVNFSDLLLSANSKFSELFLPIHSSISWQDPDSSKSIINILKLLKTSQDLNINIETFYTIFCESLLLYMSNLVFLFKSQQNIENYKKKLPKIRDHLKILAPENDYYKKFQEHFKIIWLLSEDDVTLDLTKITENSIINEEDYFNMTLTVFRAKYTGELKNGITQYICIKRYTYKFSHMDLFFIKEEIKALRKMNKEKSENNAFATYYGAKYFEKSLYLYTEYHSRSLLQLITDYKSLNNPLPNTIIENCYTLIYTLSSLKSLGIVHGNINPNNILITDTLRFCLVDITMLKHQLLSTHPKTYSKIMFSPPELFLKENKSFNSEDLTKADIYSMGMIILYIYIRQEIRGLNMKENSTQLRKTIASIEEPWIIDVLLNMLCYDPNKRLGGIALTKFIPKKFTLPN